MKLLRTSTTPSRRARLSRPTGCQPGTRARRRSRRTVSAPDKTVTSSLEFRVGIDAPERAPPTTRRPPTDGDSTRAATHACHLDDLPDLVATLAAPPTARPLDVPETPVRSPDRGGVEGGRSVGLCRSNVTVADITATLRRGRRSCDGGEVGTKPMSAISRWSGASRLGPFGLLDGRRHRALHLLCLLQ